MQLFESIISLILALLVYMFIHSDKNDNSSQSDKVCLTCKDSKTYVTVGVKASKSYLGQPESHQLELDFSSHQDDVPAWYKELGILTPLPTAVLNLDVHNPSKAKVKYGKGQNVINVDFDTSQWHKGPHHILAYWYAEPNLDARHAIYAYGDFQNKGISYSSDGKNHKIELNYPSSYFVEGKQYSPHIHLAYYDSNTKSLVGTYTLNLNYTSGQEYHGYISSLAQHAVYINALRDELPECNTKKYGSVREQDINGRADECMVYCAKNQCDASHKYLIANATTLSEKCKKVTLLKNGALGFSSELLKDSEKCKSNIIYS